MIVGGYILQPRLFDSSEASNMPPVTRELWFFLLRNVNHADNGKFKRGSGFFTLKDIQDSLCWYSGYRKNTYSKSQLSKSLRKLCERTMVETAKETRGVTVTICNYDKYQEPSSYEGNTKATRKKRGGFSKNKNGKECKNEITTKRFIVPKISEVTNYCRERSNSVDPEKFHDYYSSNGWVVGKSKMKCWKSAVRTWEKNSFGGNGHDNSGYHPKRGQWINES